jgi:small subunit ribosomal protein S2
MALPEVSMRQLLEAGVHFGHQKHRWNPRMEPYIFGVRSNIHILDLSQTVPLLHQALVKVREVAAKGGRILFVGTKRQASEVVATSAKRCAQYYINHRWLGGTLTNWTTISHSIKRLRELESLLAEDAQTGLTKKELIKLTREQDKLERSLGGIKDMGGVPDLMFIIDTTKEVIALAEARKLHIPVVAVIDTNSDPADADFPIPGNDDATRAIALYCDLIADAVLDGMADAQASLGADLGAAEEPVELALKEETPKKAPKAKAAPKSEEKTAVKPKAKAKAEPKVDAKKEAAPKVEAKEKAEPKAKAEPKKKAEPKAKAEPKKKAEPKAKADKGEEKDS